MDNYKQKDRYYTAMEEDADKDGINDVLVKDVDGNLVVVNGYRVRKSDCPYRQKFYDLDQEEKKEYVHTKNGSEIDTMVLYIMVVVLTSKIADTEIQTKKSIRRACMTMDSKR